MVRIREAKRGLFHQTTTPKAGTGIWGQITVSSPAHMSTYSQKIILSQVVRDSLAFGLVRVQAICGVLLDFSMEVITLNMSLKTHEHAHFIHTFIKDFFNPFTLLMYFQVNEKSIPSY